MTQGEAAEQAGEQLSFQKKTVSREQGRRRQNRRRAAQAGEKRQKKSSRQQQGLNYRKVETHCLKVPL